MGNNCVVADLDGNVVQRTNYYPFGLPMLNSSGEEVQPYKYNGKEYETIAGINLYDYHARQQDPILGRFTTMDPLAEKYYSISPYVYCANNPLKYIDPTGMYFFNFDFGPKGGEVMEYNPFPDRWYTQYIDAGGRGFANTDDGSNAIECIDPLPEVVVTPWGGHLPTFTPSSEGILWTNMNNPIETKWVYSNMLVSNL